MRATRPRPRHSQCKSTHSNWVATCEKKAKTDISFGIYLCVKWYPCDSLFGDIISKQRLLAVQWGWLKSSAKQSSARNWNSWKNNENEKNTEIFQFYLILRVSVIQHQSDSQSSPRRWWLVAWKSDFRKSNRHFSQMQTKSASLAGIGILRRETKVN